MSARLVRLDPLIVAALLACAAAPAAGAELGRLFYTPQQRQDLDRRRQANIQETAVTADSFVTVNGQVSRSNGKNTVWINGVPQESARKPVDPARVTVPGGEGESSINLKVGETFDRARGEVKDLTEGGSVVAPPAPRDR
ncbi:MAG TPA: hypothetical protein VE008_02535 [Burkholderiales bacterium]|nr:hypothetical protein [Burkholderiales bacterium]